jgi:glucose/mannose transport system substrate-binding protein
MIIMPDFIKTRLLEGGCISPNEIGYVVLEPAGTPTFVFVSLAFVLPKDAAHPLTGTEFLEVVGSKEGQEIFNLKKGAMPPRIDADLTGYDLVTLAEARDWRNPDERLVVGYIELTSSRFQKSVNDALARFVDPASPDHKNVDMVLGVLRDNYANIKP